MKYLNLKMDDIEIISLRKACYELAMDMTVRRKELYSDEINDYIESTIVITEELLRISKELYESYKNLGCSLDAVIRAIEYMSVHAYPIESENYFWFYCRLDTLLALTYPNYIVSDKDYEFIEIDVRKRVNKEL